MPTKTRRSGSLSTRYKKQHGLHQKRSQKYLKVYWPYLPVLVVIILGISLSITVLINKTSQAANPNISQVSLLNDTNQARASSQQSPLTLNQQLDAAAQTKANDMVAKNYWSHISTTGETPWQFISNSGYQFQTAGENLAYGFSSSNSVIDAWMNSPDHRENVINSNYSNVGFGIAHASNYQGKGPQTIIVAMYADPVPQSLGASTTRQSLTASPTHPFTNVSSLQPNSQTVARIETFSYGNPALVALIVGLIGGTAFAYIVIKHGLLIKRWALKGEELAIEHPIVDICLVLVVVASAVLSQTVGFIR